MLDNLANYHIILASNSPRRHELIARLGIDFEVRTLPDIDESFPAGLSAVEAATYISRSKASAYASLMESDMLIITADTIVSIDDTIMGKPADADEAIAMLMRLSGRTHDVVTAVSLSTAEQTHTFASTTHVTFDTLTPEEIRHYVDTCRPMDKAGAYGIQEWIGMVGVCGIEGSYFNVMGLPVQRLYKELCKIKPLALR